ncbi:MAG: hypothetical protein HFJ41_02440 [Clostridia bacterium]|nr:hypothetical protein [Clostridia bacterium]
MVTIANLAQKTNIEQEVNENNAAYIKVRIRKPIKQSLEKCTEQELSVLLKEQSENLITINGEKLSKYYYEIVDIKYDDNSKKVNEVYIDKLEEKGK